MDISIGRGKKARRAYGFDEIALCPGGRTLDPSLADTTWEIGGIKREIPIIASAMDGVVDVKMAVLLSELGSMGVLNLEGIQTRYEDPNPILNRMEQVGKDGFVGLMQELYAEPIKPELIKQRIKEIKAHKGIAAVSLTPAGASKYGQAVAEAGADMLFVQATVVSTAHLSPESISPLDLASFCQEMPMPVALGTKRRFETTMQQRFAVKATSWMPSRHGPRRSTRSRSACRISSSSTSISRTTSRAASSCAASCARVPPTCRSYS